jgi:hypothetical protein
MVQLNRNIDPTVDHNIYKVLFNKFNSINLFKLFQFFFGQEREQGQHRDADIQVYCPYYRHTVYRYILITDLLYTGISSLLTYCIQVYCPHY